ncbi:MAG: lytic transglycosylase domain-containing protein [Myxococcota bacterium]
MRQLAAALLVLGWAGSARAELYTWTDADGVVHFTNVKPGAAKQSGAHTYDVNQDGFVQRFQRVDVVVYDALITEAARYYSLPPPLVKAVVAAESAFDPKALSHAGAQGLMQLIPSTAREMHVRDPFDPRQNVYGGARYLRILANRFEGDVKLTAAGYNAGPEAVERAGGKVPNYDETQVYVKRVLKLYEHYRKNWRPPANR